MNYINNRKILLLFTIWSLWLVSHPFLLGPYSYTKLHDNTESYLPAKLSINSITDIYPFKKWNHQWEAGSDLLASTYTSDFDIPLFIFLPGWMGYGAYGLFLFLQRLIAGYFYYQKI